VDSVIERLLEVRGSRPGKQVNLAEHEVKALCIKAREIFMSQPVLLELEAPIKICGETNCCALLLSRPGHRSHASAQRSRERGEGRTGPGSLRTTGLAAGVSRG